MSKWSACVIAGVLACACAPGAVAQDDPVLDAADDVDPLAEAVEDGEAGADGWHWNGELLLRRDQVNGLENREPVDRLRLRGRLGGLYTAERFEAGAAIEAAIGSDSNDDNRRNNDNEKSDGASLDTAFVRWLASGNTSVTFGKTAFPLELTPLTWDADLRPIGVSADHSIASGDFDRLRLVGGYFAGDHLYGDDSRIAALQAGWHWQEGAPVSFAAIVTYLDFDDIDTLAREGLGRTNRRVGAQYVSDYELLDAQFALRFAGGDVPIELRADFVKNLGADDEDEGARFSAVVGTSERQGAYEFGLAYERIQRDAVLAAFNEDDWWFHSAMRGVMPWVAYGITDSVSLRVAGFFERRDDQADDVTRLLVDLTARFR